MLRCGKFPLPCFTYAFLFLVTLFIFTVLSVAQHNLIESFKSSLFYHGNVRISLAKNLYSPGEGLQARVELQNFESFPLLNTYLVIELVRGCETPLQPTYLGECNVVHEERVHVGTLLPGETKVVVWNFTLPQDLRPGVYRVDVYFKNDRTPIFGIPHSFFMPAYVTFNVSYAEGADYPRAKILWTKTHVLGGYAQSGPMVLPGTLVEGAVFVKAFQSFDGTLSVKVCPYDDTSCKNFPIERVYRVKLKKGEEKPFIINFTAPTAPNAYSIRLELRDVNGRLHSLYRSRIVVLGEGARILKMAVSNVTLESGKESWVLVAVTGPLGYSTILPSKKNVTGVKLKVWVETKGKEVTLSDEHTFPSLSFDQIEVYQAKFVPIASLADFRVCTSLTKDGKVLDEYCESVWTEKLPVIVTGREVPSLNAIIVAGVVGLLILMVIVIHKRRRML